MMFSISINLTDSTVSLILVRTWEIARLPATSLQLCHAVGSNLEPGADLMGKLQAGDGGLSTEPEMSFGAIIH
jgi:hypothetical protein